MDTQSGIVEEVTKSDLLGLQLGTWNQKRSSTELLGFIARREAAIAGFDEEP